MATKSAKEPEPEIKSKHKVPVELQREIPEPPKDGDERRFYQTSPARKEYLTKNEARAKGFYWKD